MRYADAPGLVMMAACVAFCAPVNKTPVPMKEVQLTSGLYGHMLNSGQVFSFFYEWIVYDVRNDHTHIGRTCCIEKVNVRTGEVVSLYTAPGQSAYGPGVGAASYHPIDRKIIFIHGLLNCNEEKPYGFTRRFGALLDEARMGNMLHAEARTVRTPLVAGALRGGTHAHSWSGDGAWISFTYNDAVIERLEQTSGGAVKDLRTIGVMAPAGKVNVSPEDAENFSGEYFTTVAATVVDEPRPGTDDIDKALDECWIGHNGYLRGDGTRQKRAIAFQGQMRDKNDSLLTEVFVSDIPDDITKAGPGGDLAGTQTSRAAVPHGLTQRRITFTSDRKFPGIQGPRFWMRSSPDGAFLYFLARDEKGVVQVFEVSTNGGDIRQVTSLIHSVQTQFNISPDGQSLALIADNSVWVSNIKEGTSQRVTQRSPDESAPVLTVVWSRNGKTLAYNRYVKSGNESFLQIFTLNVEQI